MEFPYIRKRGIYYPIVPVKLIHRKLELITDALVDSGAVVSVFQGSISEYLGLDLYKGERVFLQGIGGRIAAYRHCINLQIGDFSFPSSIAFSREMIPRVNILGRDDFFHHFLVTFDESCRKLILQIVNRNNI